MLEEMTQLFELDVFTPWGVRIGGITNLEIDTEDHQVTDLYIEETNEKLVEDGAPIKIPFRWVQAIGDIVILKHFPRDLPIKCDDEMGDLPKFEE